VPVTRALEDSEVKRTTVWRLEQFQEKCEAVFRPELRRNDLA